MTGSLLMLLLFVSVLLFLGCCLFGLFVLFCFVGFFFFFGGGGFWGLSFCFFGGRGVCVVVFFKFVFCCLFAVVWGRR